MRARLRGRIVWLLLAAALLAPALGWGAYAAATWLTFGGAAAGGVSDPRMDRYLAVADIAEVHRTRVAAPAAVTYDAALRMDLRQSRVIDAVFRARETLLRADAPPRAAHLPLVTELRSIGWGVLEEAPGRQIVLGAVTRPWEANVVFRALPPDAFAGWDSAGYVKLVVTFAADSLGPRASAFRTETRAVATDAASRAAFRRYWAVFSPGILLIRSRALAVVRGDAERISARAGVAAR